MKFATLAFTLVGTIALSSNATAQTVEVAGTANIFAAGLPQVPDLVGGGGTLPPGVQLSSMTSYLQFVNASGLWDCCGLASPPQASADGIAFQQTSLPPLDGISGIQAGGRAMFLVGVFLEGTTRPSTAPASLDFTGNYDFLSLSPMLGQLFFIGDGFTAGGAAQRFYRPQSATALYLGVADGPCFGDCGFSVGFYDDNPGAISIDVLQVSAVPEPALTLLMFPALVALVASARFHSRGGEHG